MSTPPEEIQRQHEEAAALCEHMPCAQSVSRNEIPLSMKQCPTITLFGNTTKKDDNSEEQEEEEKKRDDSPANHRTIIPWSSRGQIDAGPLQALVREGYRISEHTPTTTKTISTTNKSSSNNNNNKENKQKVMSNNSSSSSKHSANNNTKNTNNKPKWLQGKKYTASDIQSTTNYWDPINAAVNNVNIIRPSHDAWGIGKIVLVFADDFLQNVYELPWWWQQKTSSAATSTTSSNFQQAVQPILDCLQIDESQVVRLLLASLPPGTTIPLHHDSGAWVLETHRVHVPVLVEDPQQVLFRVGLTDSEADLQRIDCTPGHVFEMNNQCRHAVSNCSNDYRVHLILDYVDKKKEEENHACGNDKASANKSISRTQLQPGERLLQTRRSVDRLANQGSRPTPSFLILGAQKAGTTSLYEYMMQHPLIVRPKRRETHCLDWRWKEALQPNKKFTDKQLRDHCHLFYELQALQYHPSCCTGDSTPSYLLDSRRVIPNLKRVFPWRIQFLVTTRNPIQRAESHYAMVTSPNGSPAQLKTRGMEWRSKSFEQVVDEELQQLQDCGVIPYWNMEQGTCDQAGFDRFINTLEEDQAWDRYLERHVKLNTGSYGLLARGLYALNLRPWLQAFEKDQFMVLRLEEELVEDRVCDTMKRVFDHVGVPSNHVLEDVTPQNTRQYEPSMNQELYNKLQNFFEPHNERFEKLKASLP